MTWAKSKKDGGCVDVTLATEATACHVGWGKKAAKHRE
jgi:hypothetical protein